MHEIHINCVLFCWFICNTIYFNSVRSKYPISWATKNYKQKGFYLFIRCPNAPALFEVGWFSIYVDHESTSCRIIYWIGQIPPPPPKQQKKNSFFGHSWFSFINWIMMNKLSLAGWVGGVRSKGRPRNWWS